LEKCLYLAPKKTPNRIKRKQRSSKTSKQGTHRRAEGKISKFAISSINQAVTPQAKVRYNNA